MRGLRTRLIAMAGLAACLTVLTLLLVQSAAAAAEPGRAVVLELEGIIGPAADDFIVRGIETAEAEGVSLIILRMNTPGGLDSAMRDIISKILASRIPVVAYVAPPGSRAASAGTYIMYASHVAAMAPATNLGSATPVSIVPGGLGGGPDPPPDSAGGEKTESGQTEEDGEEGDANAESAAPKPGNAMERKVVNDAVAYIKGLARLRGRNEQWAEEAVRSAVNLTAEDALHKNVVDLVAKDLPDLLRQIDGRRVELQGGEAILDTANLTTEVIEPDWRTRLLGIITNPNVAYVLMLLGVYGLFFELSNPGALLPGVLGAICLLLALYSFQVLPVNYAGLALILLGMAFMVGELFVPSFGVLGIGGAASFVVGSLMLMETDVAAYQLSMPLIAVVTAVTALFVFTLIAMSLRQRRRPVVSGREQMIGGIGEAAADFEENGRVHIHGELWSARSSRPVAKGQRIRVNDMDGLTLVVEPVEEMS